MVFVGVVNQHSVRVVFQRDVNLPLFEISQRADTESDLPLFLALRLEEMGAVSIDESQLLQPREVSQLKFMEERESLPAKLPEGFYPRVKLTLYVLNKRGDIKSARSILNDVREIVVRRIGKISMLVATRPEVINDEEFLGRLTREERALLTSLYSVITSFTTSIL